MKASRIINGLRAIGVDDTTICDFINYYANGTSYYLDKLTCNLDVKTQDIDYTISELEDADFDAIFNERTLAFISEGANIRKGIISEVTIRNIDNPILNGVYRCEWIDCTDKYGADYRKSYFYKNSEYISNENRDYTMVSMLRENPNINLYTDDKFTQLDEEEKAYYICELIRMKHILKNYSIREFCTFNKMYL